MVTLDSLIVKAASKKDPVVAVASAADREVLEAVSIAIAKGIASFMLLMMKSVLTGIDSQRIFHIC